MFVRYMNEAIGFDDLDAVELSIKELKSEIAGCEKEVREVLYGKKYRFGRYNIELLSEAEREELESLEAEVSTLNKEYNELYNSFTEYYVSGHDDDGHEEYESRVIDKELEAKLRPKMQEIHLKSSELQDRVDEINRRLETISREASNKKYAELEIDAKNSKLNDAQSAKAKMITDLISSNNLDWVAESLREDIASNISASVEILDTSIYREDGKIWLYVKYLCDEDLDDVDTDYLEWDDFYGYKFPNDYSENDIQDIIRWFNTSDLELEDNNGNTETFECVYIDHSINNNVDVECDRDGDFEELSGEYTYELEFKLSRNKN